MTYGVWGPPHLCVGVGPSPPMCRGGALEHKFAGVGGTEPVCLLG